ncbi:ACT domain-containing protein [Desulforhopalus sp. 52FAK]
MKSNYITTVYGPDIPGVIKSLSLATRSYGGEWLSSKLIKADGQFAAIMNVVVGSDKELSLKMGLENDFSALTFVYSPATAPSQNMNKTIHLGVDCIDRPGLTGDLSNILTNLDICVENMECKRFVMDGIGDVFSAKIALVVPDSVKSEVIAGEIETLSEDVQVNVLG